jgi:hypothetical protein
MSDAERVLVVAGTAVDEDRLVLHLDLEEDAQLKVIAPIEPDSGLDLLAGDVDDSIVAAEQRAESTATAAEDEGAEVVETEAGEPDPLLAIEDALATFKADQIVLVPASSDPEARSDDHLAEEVRDRFSLPVRELDL